MAERVHIEFTARDLISGPAHLIKNRLDSLRGSLTSLKSYFLFAGGAAASFAGIAGLGGIVQAAAESDDSIASLNLRLRTTGRYTEDVAKQFEALSQSMMFQTGVADESIRAALAQLAVYKNLSNEEMPKYIKAVLDFAKVTGTDAVTAANALGRVLQDPVQGFRSLRAAGIIFTKDQKEVIKSMEEAGNEAGVFKYILDAVARSVAGQSEIRTFTDRMRLLKQLLSETSEGLGATVSQSGFFNAALNDVNAQLIVFLKNGPEFAALQKHIEDLFIAILKGGAATIDFLAPVVEAMLDVGRNAKEAYDSLPETIRTYGLIAAVFFGTKGLAVLATGLALANKLTASAQASAQWEAKVGDIRTAPTTPGILGLPEIDVAAVRKQLSEIDAAKRQSVDAGADFERQVREEAFRDLKRQVERGLPDLPGAVGKSATESVKAMVDRWKAAAPGAYDALTKQLQGGLAPATKISEDAGAAAGKAFTDEMKKKLEGWSKDYRAAIEDLDDIARKLAVDLSAVDATDQWKEQLAAVQEYQQQLKAIRDAESKALTTATPYAASFVTEADLIRRAMGDISLSQTSTSKAATDAEVERFLKAREMLQSKVESEREAGARIIAEMEQVLVTEQKTAIDRELAARLLAANRVQLEKKAADEIAKIVRDAAVTTIKDDAQRAQVQARLSIADQAKALAAAGFSTDDVQKYLDFSIKGVEQAQEKIGDFGKLAQNIVTNSLQTLSNSIGTVFSNIANGSVTAGEAFKQFAAGFLSSIASMIAQAATLFLIVQALKGLEGANLGGTGEFFGFIAKALGGGLAEGGIVTSPQLRLIGEAGPEAVIPLDKAGGFGGIQMNTTINVARGGAVQTNTDSDNAFGQKLSRSFTAAARAWLADEMRQGGMLDHVAQKA